MPPKSLGRFRRSFPAARFPLISRRCRSTDGRSRGGGDRHVWRRSGSRRRVQSWPVWSRCDARRSLDSAVGTGRGEDPGGCACRCWPWLAADAPNAPGNWAVGLRQQGRLSRDENVYWLQYAELRANSVMEEGQTAQDLSDQVRQRKQTWRGRRRVTPPQLLLLPKGAWFYGLHRFMPAASEEQTGDVIKGVGASGGQVTARARVLGGPQDFGQMQPGDVLVASITTPAWTSLFAMASGVVTDIGGPLSHSSIVAREYGIPAVLGTAVATRLISSGERIRVDGAVGTVTRLDQQPTAEVSRSALPAARLGKSVVVGLTAGLGVASTAW